MGAFKEDIKKTGKETSSSRHDQRAPAPHLSLSLSVCDGSLPNFIYHKSIIQTWTQKTKKKLKLIKYLFHNINFIWLALPTPNHAMQLKISLLHWMPRNSTLSSSSSFFSHLSLKLNILKGRRRTVIFLSPLSLSLSHALLPSYQLRVVYFSYFHTALVPTYLLLGAPRSVWLKIWVWEMEKALPSLGSVLEYILIMCPYAVWSEYLMEGKNLYPMVFYLYIYINIYFNSGGSGKKCLVFSTFLFFLIYEKEKYIYYRGKGEYHKFVALWFYKKIIMVFHIYKTLHFKIYFLIQIYLKLLLYFKISFRFRLVVRIVITINK